MTFHSPDSPSTRNPRILLAAVVALNGAICLTRPALATPAAPANPAATEGTIHIPATLVIAAPPLHVGEVTATAQSNAEYAKGVDAYNADQYDAALSHFTNALREMPALLEATFDRGLCYEAKDDWNAAIPEFSVVVEKAPNVYDGYLERGRAYAGRGDFDHAHADLSAALEIDPARADAYRVFGDAYFNHRDFGQAIASYNKFLGIEPKPDAGLYKNRGLAYYAVHNYPSAVADLTQFASLDAKNAADVAVYVGDSYVALKQYPAAIKAYSDYLTAHPSDAVNEALKSRALAELLAGQNTPAIADYKTYLKSHPDDKTATNNLVAAQIRAGVATLTELEAAVARDPENTTIARQLALSQIAAKEYTEAVATFGRVLAANPESFEDLYDRGIAESSLGDHTKAIADFTACTQAKPLEGRGWNRLGIEQGLVPDWNAAEDTFAQALTLKADDLDARKNHGIAAYNLHDFKTGIADLKQYAAAQPGDAQVITLLAAMRDDPDAPMTVEAAQAAVKAHPEDRAAWHKLGVACLAAKKYDLAVDAFDHANKIKSDAASLYNRGFAYFKLGDATPTPMAFTKAIADATAALALNATFPEAQLLKADAEFADKNDKAAEDDYTIYTKLPGISEANHVYAEKQVLRAAINAKDYPQVIAWSTEIEVTKDRAASLSDAEDLYNIGIAYAHQNEYAAAATRFEKALAAKPTFYQAASQAATMYKTLADADQTEPDKCAPEYDKAATFFDKAATIKGTGKDAADALYNEAAALEAKSKVTDSVEPLKIALTVWDRFLALSQKDPELPKIKAHIADIKKQVDSE